MNAEFERTFRIARRAEPVNTVLLRLLLNADHGYRTCRLPAERYPE